MFWWNCLLHLQNWFKQSLKIINHCGSESNRFLKADEDSETPQKGSSPKKLQDFFSNTLLWDTKMKEVCPVGVSVIYREELKNFYLKQRLGKWLCNWFPITKGSCSNPERWVAVTQSCNRKRIFIQCFSRWMIVSLISVGLII